MKITIELSSNDLLKINSALQHEIMDICACTEYQKARDEFKDYSELIDRIEKGLNDSYDLF